MTPLVALALIVVVGMGGYVVWPPGASEEPLKVSALAEKLHNSIAVLPFDNLSPDSDDTYFAEVQNVNLKIYDNVSKQSASVFGGCAMICIGSVLIVTGIIVFFVGHAKRTPQPKTEPPPHENMVQAQANATTMPVRDLS